MVPGEKTAHSYQTVLNGANDRRTQGRMSGAAPIWATATPSTFASRLQKPHLLRRPGGTLGEAAALRARSGRDNRHGRCLSRRERRAAQTGGGSTCSSPISRRTPTVGAKRNAGAPVSAQRRACGVLTC